MIEHLLHLASSLSAMEIALREEDLSESSIPMPLESSFLLKKTILSLRNLLAPQHQITRPQVIGDRWSVIVILGCL